MNELIERAERDRRVMSAASFTWQRVRLETDTPMDVLAKSDEVSSRLGEGIREQAGELAVRLVLADQARAAFAEVQTVDDDLLQLPEEKPEQPAAA